MPGRSESRSGFSSETSHERHRSPHVAQADLGGAGRRRFAWTDAEAADRRSSTPRRRARRRRAPRVRRSSRSSSPRTSTRRCGVLVDLIIPKDERSGSATDAGVPEFMDFMMIDQPTRQIAMRGGLAWIDRECLNRFDKPFVTSTAAQQTALLDDIAWPQEAVRASCRTASPSSPASATSRRADSGRPRSGIDGSCSTWGTPCVAEWKGCPEEVLKKLGLTPPA